MLAKHCLVCALVLVGTGCASTQDHGNGYETRSYIGWLKVLNNKQGDKPVVERVETVGLKFGPGFSFGLGYFDDKRVELPKDCHLIVVAKDIAQWQALLKNFPTLEQQELKPCIKPLDY